MKNKNTCGQMLWVVFLVGSLTTMAMGELALFMPVNGSTGYYTEISIDVAGATSVRMQRDSEGWLDFGGPFDGNEFDYETPEYGTLSAMNTATSGNYTMEIVHGSGTSVYTYTLLDPQSGWFSDRPVLADPGDPIAQQTQMTWTWASTADQKEVEYSGWNGTGPDFAFSESWNSGAPGFSDLSYDVDYGTFTGDGDFYIVYQNSITPTDLVSGWSLDSGDDVINGNIVTAVLSEAYAEYSVVPEPATLSLLAVGAVSLLRRKRK